MKRHQPPKPLFTQPVSPAPRLDFFAWLRKLPPDDHAFGELAYEIELDRNFPRRGSPAQMRVYVLQRHGREMAAAFERAHQLWSDGG